MKAKRFKLGIVSIITLTYEIFRKEKYTWTYECVKIWLGDTTKNHLRKYLKNDQEKFGEKN